MPARLGWHLVTACSSAAPAPRAVRRSPRQTRDAPTRRTWPRTTRIPERLLCLAPERRRRENGPGEPDQRCAAGEVCCGPSRGDGVERGCSRDCVRCPASIERHQRGTSGEHRSSPRRVRLGERLSRDRLPRAHVADESRLRPSLVLNQRRPGASPIAFSRRRSRMGWERSTNLLSSLERSNRRRIELT